MTNFQILRYPRWADDDIDKMILDVMAEGEFTRTLLINKVKERIIEKISNSSLQERIERLILNKKVTIKIKDKPIKLLQRVD